MRRWLVIALLWLLVGGVVSTQDQAVTVSLTSTTCPGTGCASLNIAGVGTAGIQVTGTFVGTLAFEGTFNTTFFPIDAYPVGGGGKVTGTTAIGQWTVAAASLRTIRVRMTAYTSGTAVVTIRASTGTGTVFVNTAGGGAGSSVDLTTVGGTTTSVNTGTADTGTLRVVLPNNQPAVAVTGPATDTQLRATPLPVSGTVTTTGLTDTQLRASAVPVSGPVTDTQLRATPVPVSGTVTATGPLTDTQLRASAVPVSGTVTATGPLTDTQLRASAVPVSGTFFQTTQPVNNTETVVTQAISTTTCATGVVSQTGCIIIPANGHTAFHVSFPAAGTFAGSIVAEWTADGVGTTWTGTNLVTTAGLRVANPAVISSSIQDWSIQLPTTDGAATHYRIRANIATSGATTVTLSGGTATPWPHVQPIGTTVGGQTPVGVVGYQTVDVNGSSTVTTAGTARPATVSMDGVQFVRLGGPRYFTCSFNGIAATLTQICAATVGAVRYYITDIVIQTTTTTSGTYAIQSGTGSNCATATAAMFPLSGTANRYNAPISTAGPAIINFLSPLGTSATSTAICIIGVATNTVSGQVHGYIAQ